MLRETGSWTRKPRAYLIVSWFILPTIDLGPRTDRDSLVGGVGIQQTIDEQIRRILIKVIQFD